jgi:trypsin
MSRAKLVVTVAMVAVMLAAGSAAFAAPQPPDQPQPGGQQQPSPGPGIVGGSNVSGSNQYPWIAALLDQNQKVPGGTDRNMHYCGGSLIDSDSVLTAAHCLGVGNRYMRVVLGRADLSSTGGEVRYVHSTYIHPDYTSDSKKYDVAVLTLDKPVTGITPVRLPLSTENSYEQPGKELRVAGWGATMSRGTGTNQMQQTRVPVVSDPVAAKSYPTEFVPELMIAAGGNGRDTCQGDSGGPLFSYPKLFKVSTPANPAPPLKHYQYGITSFGKGCGGADPGIYTEVNAPSIREFIITSMNTR